jgi:hypothetical protein
MKVGLLSAAERGARFFLNRRGFESRVVPTPTGRLHVYDARGSGALPTTVVLHGLGSTATSFGPLLNRIRPHARRVMAPELPGLPSRPSARQTPPGWAARWAPWSTSRWFVGNSLGGASPSDTLSGPSASRRRHRRGPEQRWEDLLTRSRSNPRQRPATDRVSTTERRVHAGLAEVCAVMKRAAIRDLVDAATLAPLRTQRCGASPNGRHGPLAYQHHLPRRGHRGAVGFGRCRTSMTLHAGGTPGVRRSAVAS